ncbi:B-cell CLL/lymphoma 7 protein family member A-like isoform X1 [Salvia divinorum]|uniref:B-cell CLL/lymphoma 7 protein family member A-like isoform X1 n=1 Tax=Salvia divinorum TaxID=28513 RepID=A0ABD1IGC1_SALDI
MEGVGARFGRSSTRYGGPAAVFTGPVRKWEKKWVHVPPPNSNNHHHTASNGTANGSNGSSHVQFYKWTPIAPIQLKDSSNNDSNDGDNGNAEPKNSSKDDDAVVEEPPKKRFKYIPIVVLEEQKVESSEQMEDENKPDEGNSDAIETTSRGDEKPDMNDTPMDDNQASESSREERQDLNESTLDLSLGLNAHDGENESNDHNRD